MVESVDVLSTQIERLYVFKTLRVVFLTILCFLFLTMIVLSQSTFSSFELDNSSDYFSPIWSPQSYEYIFGEAEGGGFKIDLWYVDDSQNIIKIAEDILDATWDNEGKAILFSTNSGLYSIDLNTLEAEKTFDELEGLYTFLSVSPSGNQIGMSIVDPDARTDIWVLDRNDASLNLVTENMTGIIGMSKWTFDSLNILIINNGNLQKVDIQTKKSEILFENVINFDVSRNSNTIFYTDGALIYHVNEANTDAESVFSGDNIEVISLDVSPDESRIAFTATEAGKTNLYILDIDDRENPVNVTQGIDCDFISSFSWSNDSEYLSFTCTLRGDKSSRNVWIVKTDLSETINVTGG